MLNSCLHCSCVNNRGVSSSSQILWQKRINILYKIVPGVRAGDTLHCSAELMHVDSFRLHWLVSTVGLSNAGLVCFHFSPRKLECQGIQVLVDGWVAVTYPKPYRFESTAWMCFLLVCTDRPQQVPSRDSKPAKTYLARRGF